jgi:hypothetical protein
MNQSDLKQWITEHIGEGRWLVFAAHLNAVREQKNTPPLSIGAIEKWLYDATRQPPAWVESYLPLIKVRLASPDDSVVLTVPFALSQREHRLVERAAKRVQITVEEFIALHARIGLESELKGFADE